NLQVRHWQNSITLFEQALSVAGSNGVIHINLGIAYDNQGDKEKARGQFNLAAKYNGSVSRKQLLAEIPEIKDSLVVFFENPNYEELIPKAKSKDMSALIALHLVEDKSKKSFIKILQAEELRLLNQELK
ncbi:tetratricopeptide repeat protein, partial [Candidatus Margulisiibacteriota bacterium]